MGRVEHQVVPCEEVRHVCSSFSALGHGGELSACRGLEHGGLGVHGAWWLLGGLELHGLVHGAFVDGEGGVEAAPGHAVGDAWGA